MATAPGPQVGLTLPSFVTDPGIVVEVARAAEAAGLDGVFLYDHLFRVGGDGEIRPALEFTALLGAVLAETRTIRVGSLVARATLRPPAVLAHAFATAARVAPGRVIAALGSGDEESRAEMETFGYDFGTTDSRVDALAAALHATRGHGTPVWVGGTSARVRRLAAADADGWNRWGGDAVRFADDVRSLGPRRRGFDLSWGGLVVLAGDDGTAAAKAERLGAGSGTIVGGPATVAAAFSRYVAAGAHWVIAGPVDATDPDNTAWLAAARRVLRGE